MSLYLEFEPHSWYRHFAIKDNRWEGVHYRLGDKLVKHFAPWEAFTDDGNTYRIVHLEADTLRELKANIRQYWQRKGL